MIALGKDLLSRKVGQVEELVGEGFTDTVADGFRFTLGAAQRFRDDVVDYAEFKEILRRHFQRGGGIRDLCGIVQRMAAQPSGEMTE